LNEVFDKRPVALQRLFALQRLAGLGLPGTLSVFLTLAVASRVCAQPFGDGVSSTPWAMIDQDTLPVSIERPAVFVSQLDLSQPSSQWSIDGDFLALTRNDELSLHWHDGFTPRITNFHSNSQFGFRLNVMRGEAPLRERQESGIYQGSLLIAGDENEYSLGLENWDVISRLAIAEINGGLRSVVFGVQTSMLAGLRYAYVTDQYDQYQGATLLNDDFVAATNQASYVQGKLGGVWTRGRFAIDASLSGGVGINASHQEGFELDLPGWPRYESNRWSMSTLAEVVATLAYQLSERADVHLGCYGLSLSEVTTSRTGFSGAGELDDARYLGLMIGARFCF
jgi:hypothetical protein